MTETSIRPRILVPLAVAFLLVVGLALVAFDRHNRYQLGRGMEATLSIAQRALDSEIEHDAELMRGLLDLVQIDPCLRHAFKGRDRDALLGCAAPLFQGLKRDYRVTHFYVHDLDGVNFLRVHNPARFGDRIDRFTLRDARETGKVSSGIELGPYGTFTLRVVQPWTVDGVLVAYLELGEEIEHILPRVKRLLGADLAVVVYKQFLDQAAWTEGLRMLGRWGDWDQYPNFVTLGATFSPGAPAIAGLMDKYIGGDLTPTLDLSVAGRHYAADSAPLRDTGGRRLGEILVFSDITAARGSEQRIMLHLGLAALAIGALVFGFFWFYLGRIQDTLRQIYTRLQATIESQRATAAELRAQEGRLAGEVAHREQTMAEEHALGS